MKKMNQTVNDQLGFITVIHMQVVGEQEILKGTVLIV
jgi:hypothetical protein